MRETGLFCDSESMHESCAAEQDSCRATLPGRAWSIDFGRSAANRGLAELPARTAAAPNFPLKNRLRAAPVSGDMGAREATAATPPLPRGGAVVAAALSQSALGA